MPKTIERPSASATPFVQRFPDVRGGVCEFCGIQDKNLPAEVQYKLCQHYKSIGQLRCSYCPEDKNPDDVIYHSNMTIYSHPDNPDKLIVCCNSYNCTKAHEKRFKVGSQ